MIFRFFEGLINPFPPEHPVQPPKGVFAFCRHYIRGMEPLLAMMAVLTATLAVSEALLYGMLGEVVDWLASKDPSTFLESHWPELLLMSGFILVFIPIIVFLHSTLVHQTFMGNLPMSVRWSIHRYLINQSYRFFQDEFSGRIATKVMQTALSVRESVMKVLDVMLFISVYLATTLILVASSDWRMSTPIVIWLFAYVMTLRFFLPRLRAISSKQAHARSDMTGRIVDSYTNVMTLKLFSHSDREAGYIKEGMTGFLNTVHPQMRLVTLLNVSVWSCNMLLVFATGALGIYLWQTAAVTPGALAIALSLAIRITGMSHWIMWEVSNLFEQIGTVEDGMNTIALEHSVQDAPNAKSLAVNKGEIDFDQVTFSYNQPDEKQLESDAIFNALKLTIASGEKVGVVGRSGAGKSTLLNLLLRFYDVDSGQIKIDGHDISSVKQESLRQHIAMVTQDTSLLHRSVRENILFGCPDATEAQMIAAAKQAQAHDFIQELQDSSGRSGYDAHVGERGVSLSGGQRQRIAIARVLLKDAPILVLDEATSALDSEVEATIQHNLYQLMEGKTVIAIAHRLSTIAAMDRLLVFDEGEIVEQGTHAELIELGGLYAQLWAHQSGGFLGVE